MRNDTKSIKIALNDPAKAPTEVMATLDPSKLPQVGGAKPSLKERVIALAERYTPGAINELFAEVSGVFEEVFLTYRELAVTTLEEALKTIKGVEVPKAIDADTATTALKGEIKSLATKRLDKIEELKQGSALKSEIQRLLIGITGSPNPAVLPTMADTGILLILPIVATMLVTMVFEVAFNAPLLQDKTDFFLSALFTVAVSLGGTATVYFAGKAMRGRLNQRNAETEWKYNFPDGMDSETRKKADTVYPLPGDEAFNFRFWHLAMAFVLSATLIIRYTLASEVGDMAGSFVIIFVFVLLYGYEAKFAKITHPRTAEYLRKSSETTTASTELKALEGSIMSPEAKAAYTKYALTLTGGEAGTKAKERKSAADTFIRLATEFLGAPKWFETQLTSATEALVVTLGEKRTESNDELSEIALSMKPDFSVTDLPFDIQNELESARKVPGNIETTGTTMQLAQFESEMSKATAELLATRKAAPVRVTAPTPAAATAAQVKHAAWKMPPTK